MSPNIHFAMGGAIFGDFTIESTKLIAKHSLPGVEPYRGQQRPATCHRGYGARVGIVVIAQHREWHPA